MYEPQSSSETFQVGFTKTPRREFGIYGRAYFEAAERLLQEAISAPFHSDYSAYPIMFLYRHALELDLKACIYNPELLGRHLDCGDLDHQLNNQHNLLELARRAKLITDKIFSTDTSLCQFMTEVVRETKHIQTIDPGSFAFRYPIKPDGMPSFPAQSSFGLKSTGDKMAFLHHGLQAIHFGIDISETQRLQIFNYLLDAQIGQTEC